MATTIWPPRSTRRSPASGRATAWLSPLLALAGLAVAAYLTSVHFDDRLLLCGVGDCETVQKSRYAEIGGVPIALLGCLMYLAILALSVVRWRRPALRGPATFAAFALALAGAVYAIYLTHLEIWVIEAICQWCVASAMLTLGILLVESRAVWLLLEPAERDVMTS